VLWQLSAWLTTVKDAAVQFVTPPQLMPMPLGLIVTGTTSELVSTMS
jgi:hypothetical protein